jgi:UDP-N-acetylmuramoyl-L-alanyl-D-glutamate--2,6-diaminopimelate ligase
MALKKIIPKPLLHLYHFAWALAGAVFCGFPSRKITVIGVAGTKGKTTTSEMLTKILEYSGAKTALANGLRFKIGENEKPNFLKMTMPGRGRLQKFLRDAVNAGCRYAVLEVTSEGNVQHRHRFIKFDIACLTNLQKDHIEAHGSFEAYRAAEAELFRACSGIHILNLEDPHFEYFKKIPAKKKIFYSRQDINRLGLTLPIPGEFNLENTACAAAAAQALEIPAEIIRKALAEFAGVPGRMQFIQKEPFSVIVDYAHTPDSLEAVYKTIRPNSKRLICVLGSAGGGRDKWKRPVMGEIATKYCDEIILTDEDPYDENPNQILSEIESGITNYQLPITKTADRKEAIKKALRGAKPGDAVIITGKGAERFMVVGKKKIPWSDAQIAESVLRQSESQNINLQSTK